MARKTALDLNDPIAVARMRAEDAAKNLDVLWRECDKMLDKTGDNLKRGISDDDYDAKLTEIRRATHALFGAVDRVTYLEKHKDDPPTDPPVPVADTSAVINASLSDKMDELCFSVNHGLLASAIAKAIAWDVTEESADPPLCADHAG